MSLSMPRITLGDGRDFLDWREGQARTVEVFDIVVGTERRKGIGRKLVERLLAEIPKDTAIVYAITRMGNVIAHEFYESLGFRIVGRLHNFYRDGGEVESALMYGLDI